MNMNIQAYRDTLRSLPSPSSEVGQKAWRDYLTEHSGLPGPRGNLELAQTVALEGNEAMFAGYLAEFTPQVAPVNSPQEFLYFCGVLGLGRMVAEGKREYLEQLQRCASDPRWRARVLPWHCRTGQIHLYPALAIRTCLRFWKKWSAGSKAIISSNALQWLRCANRAC